MQALKTIGLGVAFSFAGFAILSVISIMRGTVSFETGHATGLSAMVGGVIEALFSPITWLVIVIAFAAATWVTGKTSKRTST
jgi:uncharacterized membrane protein